jgi:hypothetical protein
MGDPSDHSFELFPAEPSLTALYPGTTMDEPSRMSPSATREESMDDTSWRHPSHLRAAAGFFGQYFLNSERVNADGRNSEDSTDYPGFHSHHFGRHS